MDQLHQWLTAQLEEKKVEPNSGLVLPRRDREDVAGREDSGPRSQDRQSVLFLSPMPLPSLNPRRKIRGLAPECSPARFWC